MSTELPHRRQLQQSPNIVVRDPRTASTSRGPSPNLRVRSNGQAGPSNSAAPQNASRHQLPSASASPESPHTNSIANSNAYAHRRSTSLSGTIQGVGNLNRWSKSTVSSGSTHSSHQRPSSSTRRMSISGSTTFLLGADPTTEKRAPAPAPASVYSSPKRAHGNSSTLPPIVTLPNAQGSMRNASSPSGRPSSPSPSTAGLLSAAVRTTVPDYFGKAWEDSTPRAFSASPSNTTDQEEGGPREKEERRRPRGHSRHRSQAQKGSTSTGGSGRNSKGSSQKAMLSKALQKANTAVLLDNAQNFEGAMQAYSEACALLQQVMSRSSGDEDKRKLEAIRNTYTSRINELRRITPQIQDEGKALPQRPESGGYAQSEFHPPTDDEEIPIIETATVTRIVNDHSYTADPQGSRSIPNSQLPIRRESLVPSALEGSQYSGRFGLDPPFERSQSNSPALRDRVREMDMELPPAMDSIYMPPPLSPRRLGSPLTYGSPNSSRPRQPPSDLYKTSNSSSNSIKVPSKGHTRAPSNESMSWLDTIDESGGSAASSVHSRTSSRVRRKRIRAASGATEAEFDAALDAAVEAAYDDGLEPADSGNHYDYDDDVDDDGDDDAIVASVRRRVQMAKEKVRQTEREASIMRARERERKRLLSQNSQRNIENEYGDESEEEERLLEEMTREYAMDDFEFGLQSKSALPRESDSSGFSGRTSGWNSSIGSNPTTAGTSLSTVTETSFVPHMPSLHYKTSSNPPPPGALPPPPPTPPNQGVRSRRLSGQNAKQLKIETAQSPAKSAPRIPDNGVAIHPKTSAFPPRQPLSASRPPLTISNRLPSSTFSTLGPSDPALPPTPTLTQSISDELENGVPASGSPGRTHSRTGLRKNFSSTSLKNMKGNSLGVSYLDDGSEVSPNTPGSAMFTARDANGRIPALPVMPTPLGAAFKEKVNGTSGGLYLFASDIQSPDSPMSPNPIGAVASANAPIPLEPCPTESLLRPFWLMRALYQTIAHPRGGYLSTKLFVPRDVWRVKGVKLKGVEDKIANCDFLTAALMKLSRVDTFDADAVLEEMQSFEGVLEQVQTTLTKKLGNEVGMGYGSVFKDTNGVEAESTASKAASSSSKSSSFSWRRLRSKGSSAQLSGSSSKQQSIPDLPKENIVMGTLPMTTTSLAKVRFAKRDLTEVQFSGPNAQYMSSLARLFDAAQAIDQIARQVEDPGLRHADKTQVGLELCTRHAAEFFGFYICRFVLNDITLLLDKFIKRGSEWVLV
ncbi:hypothetical protein HYFRA_00004188 [Hymenoscyphus fraxineus]|uniref:MIT domain-containing protein n=1 Tax=Hymenoscyphus fraxineus TaxID=746836 RepID=A0A9N9KMU4_9HELO|nr:hypothetical protein HYFRA_00004188 [Hymenoscyphus fraxineus]